MLFFWLFLLIAGALILITGFWLAYRSSRTTRSKVPRPTPPPFPDLETGTEIAPPPPAELPAPSSPAPELPQHYGEDRLVLLARDPHWLFAYWEISATLQEQFEEIYGPGSWHTSIPVLRLYDITLLPEFKGYNAHSFVDIPINNAADNWYIEVNQPDRTFCVDLGRRLSSGDFVTLLRSNPAHTPRASLSEHTDEEWLWLEEIYRSLYRYQFGLSSPLLVEEVQIQLGREQLQLGEASPIPWFKGGK
ncbi:DUF4912 domain-containing protein [Desulfothermobacter acidiphilus]|uniref:DUF4912 domain-containing protein n=1 Tax=Desulfothermobacter acidiphilus TaxID=1938353 RepID=UPI003F8BB9AE